MPDSSGSGQAGFHASRGWIFVACDSLGFGDSTAPGGNVLTLDNIAAGNAATVDAVMKLLEDGTLTPAYPAVRGGRKLGIGQSMGGCFTIVAQARHQVFDGIAALGSSAIHTLVPSRPGTPPIAWPWLLRSAGLDDPVVLNASALAGQALSAQPVSAEDNPMTWSFHWDDEPADVVKLDMEARYDGSPVPSWRSAVLPPSCGGLMVAPGVVATEAASITAPVLIAVGERDVVPNPWLEPAAFKSATDSSVYVCPRMAHMHNFAHTRQQFWRRIHSWGDAVAIAI
jgi:pimeloyl-ACP methyl ester carboxylesterase